MTRRRWMWLLLALVLAGAVVLGRSLWLKRSAASAAGTATATAKTSTPAATPTQAIELAPGDTARATQAELGTALAITGSLKAVNSAVVKAKVAGELKVLTVREGEKVSAGQLIGQLDATEYEWRLRQAQDQATAAQSQLDIAKRTLDNNKALVDQGFISRNALDTADSTAAGANASLQAAKAAAEIARKSVRDSEVRAPITGLIAQRLAQPGERVGIDQRIVEIVDLSRIELEAAVASDDVVGLRVGQSARVAIDGLVQAVPARVVRINPSAQSGSRTVLAYLELLPSAEQKPALRQGLFGRASIDMQRKTALVVPVSALRLDQALPYVLTLENGKAVQRRVSTGLRGDVSLGGVAGEASVEIVSGLEAGAVVLRGTVGALREGTLLKLAAVAAPAPAAPASPASAAR
jgi:membrane fusion protein, multidrug efflux system